MGSPVGEPASRLVIYWQSARSARKMLCFTSAASSKNCYRNCYRLRPRGSGSSHSETVEVREGILLVLDSRLCAQLRRAEWRRVE